MLLNNKLTFINKKIKKTRVYLMKSSKVVDLAKYYGKSEDIEQ